MSECPSSDVAEKALLYFERIMSVQINEIRMKDRLVDMDIKPQEIRVAVLSGGSSGERDVSIESGKGVAAALREAGFCVDTLDPSSKEDLIKLIQEAYDVCFLALHGKGGEDGTIQGFLETIGLPYTGPGVWSSATAIDKIKSKSFYRAFGVNTPRSLVLESANVPVGDVVDSVGVHCVVKAATEGSALGESFYRAFGVNTPRSLVLESANVPVGDVVDSVGVHCVVKAATEGSALGVYICHAEDEIAEAMAKVFQVDSAAFVEEYISGDEFTVAVLDNGEPKALPVIKIVPSHEFYDYESKYAAGGSQHIEYISGDEFTVAVLDNGEPKALPVIKIVPSHEFYDYESKYAAGGSQHICPAPLSKEDFEKAQELAVKAHRALECTGVSRTDLIQDENGEFWVLETNTLPGMTATSLLPDAARAAGMDFPTLCKNMVAAALAD